MHTRVVFVGIVPVREEGVPPDEVECRDAVKFLRRKWRKLSSYRHGVPDEAQISIDEKREELRLTARTFAPNPIKKFQVVAKTAVFSRVLTSRACIHSLHILQKT